MDWLEGFAAASDGNVEKVREFVTTCSAKEKAALGTYFLHAAEEGHLEVVHYLLEFVEHDDVKIALKWAVDKDRRAVVHFLIPLVDPSFIRQYI